MSLRPEAEAPVAKVAVETAQVIGRLMKVESHDKTIGDVLQNYLQIPRFQRPFSWGPDQLADFWDDVVIEREPEYFLGSIVLFPGSKGVLQVVDGQQRLTTITIVPSVIRDIFVELGEDDLAEGTQTLIERKNRRNKAQFVLKTETSYPYFQSRVQAMGDGEDESLAEKPEENAIKVAVSFFEERLGEIVRSHVGTSIEPSERSRKDLIARLEQVRDSILDLNVIEVRVADEDDAYVIFETLNTRGLNLGLSDLIRNFVLRGMTTDNDELDLCQRQVQSADRFAPFR